jgi:uncharacterized protein (TIGR02118 family)
MMPLSLRSWNSAGPETDVLDARDLPLQPTWFVGPIRIGKTLPMIRLSVYYPKTEGATFDHEYFRTKHRPLAFQRLGAILEGGADRGIDGPYEAAGHAVFESLEAMQAAMSSPGGQIVRADLVNYTTIAPIVQISEIVEVTCGSCP